jgi:hypothetical protein
MNVTFISRCNTFSTDHGDLHFHTSFKENRCLVLSLLLSTGRFIILRCKWNRIFFLASLILNCTDCYAVELGN